MSFIAVLVTLVTQAIIIQERTARGSYRGGGGGAVEFSLPPLQKKIDVIVTSTATNNTISIIIGLVYYSRI